MGAVALTLSILAGVVASGVAGLAAFGIARGAGTEFVARGGQAVDWRLLSPRARPRAGCGESPVVGDRPRSRRPDPGIVATVRNSGRASVIAAIVISALGRSCSRGSYSWPSRPVPVRPRARGRRLAAYRLFSRSVHPVRDIHGPSLGFR